MHSGCDTPREQTRGWLNFVLNTAVGILTVAGVGVVMLAGGLFVQYIGSSVNTRWILIAIPAILVFYVVGCLVRRDL